MKATEFAYWLQGYFEINSASSSPLGIGGMGAWETGLSEDQAQAVMDKAATVKVGQGPAEAQAGLFVAYAIKAFMGKSYEAGTAELKQKLHDLFVHAIDPSYEGDQTQLNQLHKPNGGNGPVMRC